VNYEDNCATPQCAAGSTATDRERSRDMNWHHARVEYAGPSSRPDEQLATRDVVSDVLERLR
jgi:hypothetical protein